MQMRLEWTSSRISVRRSNPSKRRSETAAFDDVDKQIPRNKTMSSKVLLTGANGFVARHLLASLKERGDEVIGVDVGHDAKWPVDGYYPCNLLSADAVRIILSMERPDVIVHLAAVSSVSQSWNVPVDSFLNNTNIFLNVVEAVRSLGLGSRVLSVGSSEEYGNLRKEDMPISEEHQLAPVSPYAVARVSQEQLSGLYAKGFGLDVVMTRSFNQIGPGQRTDFVVASFVSQLLRGKKAGNRVVKVNVGDLSIVRDFLDVRDAVAAYCLLIDKGVCGEVYNVCSGTGRTLKEVLLTIAAIVGVDVELEVDPMRIRPADNHVIIGSNRKMMQLGWELRYSLESSIRDMIESVN